MYPRKQIDLDALRKDAETMTKAQMAAKHGCSMVLIGHRLRELGIKLRRGMRKKMGSTAIVRATPRQAITQIRRIPRGDNSDGSSLVTIQVSERVLDHLWLSLPPATKGDLLNGLEDVIRD